LAPPLSIPRVAWVQAMVTPSTAGVPKQSVCSPDGHGARRGHSAATFGISSDDLEKLRRQMIAQFGAVPELIAPSEEHPCTGGESATAPKDPSHAATRMPIGGCKDQTLH
jgi:hypothetical protein